MANLLDFTDKYQLSKTLRFELKPIGRTLEHIQTKGLLLQDANRAKSYQEVKKLIDRYHQHFIELALSPLKLTQLEDLQNLYFAPAEAKKEDDFKKKFEKIQEELRKEIVTAFKTGESNEIFKVLDKKELITKLMVDWLEQKEDKDKVEEFKTFTTYFTGFHENRKNMYTDKAQSTAIAYRLVHENLPKFLDNIKVFEKLKAVPELYEKCSVLYKEIEEYLNIRYIDEAFELGYYNMVLTQKQIEVYNLIIGGRTPKENEKKIQGLNEYINLYNQKQQDKKNKIPKLKPLYKMILSDRESVSFLAEKFDNSQEVLNAIKEYYHANIKSYQSSEKDDTENVLERVKDLLANLSSNNLFQIYIRNGKAITDISQALFGDFSLIKDALKANFEKTLPEPKGKSKDTRPEKIEKYLKQDYFSIAEIETALWNYRAENDLLKDLKEEEHLIASYFNSHFKTTVNDKEYDLVANVMAKYSCIKGLLEQDYPEDKKLNQETKEIDEIKAFLDALMLVLHFVKPLMLPNDSTLEKDQSFYNTIAPYYEQLQHLVSLYNKVRNFASQKAYSVEKIKLNFGIGHFFNGWGSNYDTKSCLVIIKNGQYYLLIVDKKLSKDDLDFLTKKPEEHLATRVIYDFQKPDNKNIPRLFIRSKGDNFAPAVMKYNLPIDKVIDIYDNGLFKTDYRSKNPIHFKECLIKLIDYFKLGFENHESYKHYKFSWKKSQDYNDIAEFYKDVESSCYKLDFEEINFNHLLELISQKKGYLFQIYNKDFSEYSKGKSNMHTLYWKALFDPENLKDVVYKLNGQAEIFYRKSSIKKDKVIVHKANEKVVNKNPLNTKKESLFSYDLVKDKRFTLDKFQFHVPITLNFKASGNDYI
ncbi:MAG TPA: type V CRISPR-associated protein Cas12a/Cpf1, partial [Chitinophagales bacterium]|nr:type V CRISPR-associated protein Cas12a/Cpf1 [Chitinophagales bacterium]